MKDIIIGIDLGTTNSAVAIVQNGEPRMLTRGEQRIMPSVVAYSKQAGWLVGQAALNQYTLDPVNTVRSIKRNMGSPDMLSLGGHELNPQQISAFILRELKAIAEEALEQPISKAVITVPAYFTNAQRQATKEAGEIAGLEVVRIINEPTAAALAYGLNKEDDQLILVYDLGGGTFDVSLVEMMSGIVEVRASHGDTHLGGDDFDQRLADHASKLFYKKHQRSLKDNRLAMARLNRAAETAKIRLTNYAEAPLREEYLLEEHGVPKHLDDIVERLEFEDMTADLLEKTTESLTQVLQDGESDMADLNRVLLVGGSTRMPMVWDVVANLTGLEPEAEINPDEVVALGAAVQAAIIAGEPVDSILVDVTPYSLGIEAAIVIGGQVIPDVYSVLIHRNSTVPTTKEQIFETLQPDQEKIAIKVYQGEAPQASANTLLGEFIIEGLKPARFGERPSVNIRFDFDSSGMLHVSATDRVSGSTESTSVQATQTRLSPTEIAAARDQLQEIYLDQLESEGIVDGQVPELDAETEALLDRGRSLLEAGLLSDEQAGNLENLMQATKHAATQDALDDLAEDLLDTLFDLE